MLTTALFFVLAFLAAEVALRDKIPFPFSSGPCILFIGIS